MIMEQDINELVERLTSTEGITYIKHSVKQGEVQFSFLFDSYAVLDKLREKMPENWFLHIVGIDNICYLTYKLPYLELYFLLLRKVKAAFFIDDFIDIFCNKH